MASSCWFGRRVLTGSLVIALAMGATGAAADAAHAPVAPAIGSTDWPSFLHGPAHHSENAADTAITAAAAPDLDAVWTWHVPKPTMAGQPQQLLYASPTVVAGTIYIGAKTGQFYAINADTGKERWHHFLGFRPDLTCGANGIISTATVAADPTTRALTVYVEAPDGNLYALDAATGTLVWKSPIDAPSSTVSDYFQWSSPLVVHGKIYVGVSSQCDHPLVPGGEESFDQATGRMLASFTSVPAGVDGGSIWSSAAELADGSIAVDTGNGYGRAEQGHMVSVVRLDPNTLAPVDAWQLPLKQNLIDDDFGSSVTSFTATLGGTPTQMAGACNKNGYYYAFRADDLAAGPVWTQHVGDSFGTDPYGGQCDAAAAWDGTNLYIGGPTRTVNGTRFPGSISQVDPQTGRTRWTTGLPGTVIGSPTLNANGVLAVPMYGPAAGVVLIDSATGAILAALPTVGPVFAQAVFAEGHLFVAGGREMTAYAPP